MTHPDAMTIDDLVIGLGRQQVRAIRAENALEQAEARIDQLTDTNERLTQELALANDTLRRRTEALNRTGEANDQMRATLARVYAATIEVARMDYDGPTAVRLVRAALDDQETPA